MSSQIHNRIDINATMICNRKTHMKTLKNTSRFLPFFTDISWQTNVFCQKTRDHTTWKKHHPDLIHRAVILLGGNDLVNLTEERLANPNTPRRHCHTLITNPIILRQQAVIIARLILSLRGLLLQYVPRVFICTLIPRDVAINYDQPITIINDHLRDSLKSKHVIPLHLHLHKCHLCQDGIHLNHHGCEILTTMLRTITQWSTSSSDSCLVLLSPTWG